MNETPTAETLLTEGNKFGDWHQSTFGKYVVIRHQGNSYVLESHRIGVPQVKEVVKRLF